MSQASSYNPYSSLSNPASYIAVVSIDFGTARSGYAFSYFGKNAEGKVRIFHGQLDVGGIAKTRTALLRIPKDGGFRVEFGSKALSTYTSLSSEEKKKAQFFDCFKMKLYGKLSERPSIKAANQAKVPVVEVISDCLRFISDHALEAINRDSGRGATKRQILWVLTVPAIWSPAAKQLMKEAARKAGMLPTTGGDEQLVFALEPEAASLCVRYDIEQKTTGIFTRGTRYFVLDCGGGTIDSVAHELKDATSMAEICYPSGSDYGSTRIDQAFFQLLCNLFGKSLIEEWKEKFGGDVVTMFKNFENLKESFSLSEASTDNVYLPRSLTKMLENRLAPRTVEEVVNSYVLKNRRLLSATPPLNSNFAQTVTTLIRYDDEDSGLRLTPEVMYKLMKTSIDPVVEHLRNNLHALKNIKYVMLVGGFGGSKVLASAIETELQKSFPQIKLLQPANAGLAILHGAIYYGLDQGVISSRVANCTVGIGTSRDVTEADKKSGRPTFTVISNGKERVMVKNFCKFVSKGESVPANSSVRRTVLPTNDRQNLMNITLYHTDETDPEDLSKSTAFGELTASMNYDLDNPNRSVEVELFFGRSYIQVKATHLANNNETEMIEVDFLANEHKS